ncbi:MAG: hypothetical protein KA956_05905 [Pyrinomonadaceae bacterium]|nr:hypothetical protein [Acidobacteriota bacterium]MBK7933561.1 hypothetical protein [Acidobacteriota bacterium]MBP7375992.1 hypothetical protein [Pyrinomonadaceae bacterium]
MNVFAAVSKTAGLLLLIFANFVIANAQVDSIYRLPAGTRITVKLETELSSKVSSVNDTFKAFVAKSVIDRETVILPAGTEIEGRVIAVSRAKSGGKNGKLDIVFEWLRLSKDAKREIDGVLITKIRTESSSTLNALSLIGGTATGALIGAAAMSGKGALIGAGIGAGTGTGVLLLRKGKEMRIAKDREFEIELKKEVVLPVLDY